MSHAWQALLPSFVLVVPCTAMHSLRGEGRLSAAASLARHRCLGRRLRKLQSSILRRIPQPTLSQLAPLLEMRVCAAGEAAVPPEHPDSFVIVAEGAVDACTDAASSSAAKHTPQSACCWCNEATLLGRKGPAVPPVAAESPTIVYLCPPHNFGALKAAMPHLVAAAVRPPESRALPLNPPAAARSPMRLLSDRASTSACGRARRRCLPCATRWCNAS